jgi:nucleoside-diphosphate-sugar epimerase
MKNILVTGTTGFIGSYLLPILSQHKFQITAAVRNNLSQSLSGPIKIVKVDPIDEKTNWQNAEGLEMAKNLPLALKKRFLRDS